jgi:bifunctional DNase/RNase
VIDKLENNTFYAKLILERDNQEIQVDARPSDSVALALRAGAPIFVAEEVLEEAGLS